MVPKGVKDMDNKKCMKKAFSKEKIAMTLLVSTVLVIYGGIFLGLQHAMKDIQIIGF